ncbi:unknown [Betafusellovirus yellowstonense]|uniref:Uncharacterized protein n=1 Tax=Betafusellovirus yellowstonense TaxID=693629 RepID=D1GF98_9VIRU|nr:hypothetical protein SSSV1_gp14 [Acidianus spindle-shaped virus 1]ACZ35799.1 unknown [Acidianus spindle-shaped virus 1]
MDKETLKRIVAEKLKKDGDGKNNSVPPQNSNNLLRNDKNSPEVNKGYNQNVPFAPVNLSTGAREKLTGANGTNHSISSKTSGEFSSSDEEEIEEGVEIKDNIIIIKTKDKHKFEIYYGFAGTIEDNTRIIDLKVPQLPQWNFVAKKKDETLSILITIDFYQAEGKTIYHIRNKKEIIGKLYAFRGQRNISKKLINDALDLWLERIEPEKYIQWTDVREVVKKYEEWEEINQDPLNFFLSRASEVIGNEKLKAAVLLSIVSSQLRKLFGIYRVHLILTGSSGAGKSSTIKSILKMFYEMSDGIQDWIVLNITRMTKESLGYLDVGSLDDKVLFIEQLDNIEGVGYLREAMSEGRITTLIPVKTETGDIKTEQKIIPGQPAFITTNVTANVDHQILNRSIQLYLSPAEDEKLKTKIIETILEREPEEELQKLKLITYVWLKTRPISPKMTKEVKDELIRLLSKFINFKNIYRATEITRNLVRAAASLFGHEEIQKDDVNFVMSYFKKDIILTTLELSERDLNLLKWLRDHGFIQGEKDDETIDVGTAEIAQYFKMATQEVKKILDSLYDKGLLWKAYDGKRFSWALSHYGLKVLDELEKEVGEKEEEIQADIEVDDMLLNYVRSKLLGKDEVTEEELQNILEKTVQATDTQSQQMWIDLLEKMSVIKKSDGKWKVL